MGAIVCLVDSIEKRYFTTSCVHECAEVIATVIKNETRRNLLWFARRV